jgi:hypothetical protein
VDYYSDAVGGFQDMEDYPYGDASVPARLYMPQFNFVKKETWDTAQTGSSSPLRKAVRTRRLKTASAAAAPEFWLEPTTAQPKIRPRSSSMTKILKTPLTM